MIAVGFVTKILGMANRVFITRLLGEVGIGVYMLISPTVMLLATLATVGLPVAISTLVSRENMRQKKILSTAFVISMTLSLIITVVLFFVARPLAVYMLKDERTFYPLLLVGPLLFCISFNAIVKSYFQGKQNMIPSAGATLVEQIVRIVLSIALIQILLPIGITHAVVGLMVASIIGELASALILAVVFIRYKNRLYPDVTLTPARLEMQNFKSILAISLPTTGSRLVGTITNFLEPIIIARTLFRIGFDPQVSTKLYGAVSGFAIPVLFMPSFISVSVTQAIIPAISRSYTKRMFGDIHQSLNTAFKIAFFTSGFYTLFVVLFPTEIMNFLYDSNTGAHFLPLMAPVFLLLYFQAPLIATLQAIDEAHLAMRASIFASILKITLMTVLLSIPSINIYGLVIAILINIVVLTVWYYQIVAKKIGYKMNKIKVVHSFLVLGIVYLTGVHLKSALPYFNSALLNIASVAGIMFAVHSMLSLITGLVPLRFRNK